MGFKDPGKGHGHGGKFQESTTDQPITDGQSEAEQISAGIL
ncbi:hypothetical protein NCCP133_16630 [Cytobacillus sp. NCCP-133]|nr:hypothetical protein NCCP133_16630 [Cytobacillus sp. NCCP-133]